jgi:hypothetical protein
METLHKKHRLVADSELFSIFESTPEEVAAAEDHIGDLARTIFDGIYQPDTYKQLVQQRRLVASTVVLRGELKPAFVLFHTITPLGWLTIEGAAALKPSSIPLMYDTVDRLAEFYGCPVTQVITKLAGMLRVAKRRGYKTTGVILHKKNVLPCP